MEPKISVTTVAYNSARFLDEAILSVRNQSFSDFEFIIINDCSTDNSWEIITSHAAQDNRIVAINNETNLGSLVSGNKALSHVRGKYIAVFDSDDVCLPNRFQLQYEYLQSHPDIALVGAGAELINESGQIIGRKYPPTDVDNIRYLLLLRNPIIHPSVMLRKSVLDMVGNYNPEYLHAEDYKLYSSLVSAHYNITNLSQVLIKYRRSPQSLSISPKTRVISLANARRVSFDNVQKYLALSHEDVNIAVNTINRLSTGLNNVIKTIRINRDLMKAYIKKEELSSAAIQSVRTIYNTDRKLIWKHYLKTRFSWLYKITKTIFYFSNHKFVKQTATLQIGSFGGTIVQAVVGILIARLLQPELLGIYSLAFGLAATTSLVIGMGIQESASSLLGRAYAKKDKTEIENVLGFMFKITFFAALTVLIFSIFLPNIAGKLYDNSIIGIYASIIVVAVVLSSFFFTLAYSISQVTGKIKSLTYLIVADQSLRSGLSLILVMAGLGVFGAVSGHAVGALIIFIFSALLFRNLREKDLIFPDLRRLITVAKNVSLKKYFGFTFWVALDRNMGNLFMVLPVILAGIYVTASEVSFFRLAFGYVNLALSLLGPISVLLNVEFPKLQTDNKEKLIQNFKKVSLYSLGLSVFLTITAIIVSPIAFKILYGKNFLPSVPYVAGLIVYGALYGIGVGLGPMWRAINKVKVSILINSVILGVGIPLGLWLIKSYGLWGSVIMVTMWFVVSHFISFFYLIRKLRKI